MEATLAPRPHTPQLDDATLEGLATLAQRADEIALLLDWFTGVIARGPVIAENLNDTVNQIRRANTGKVGGALAAYGPVIEKAREVSSPERLEGLLGALSTFQEAFESDGVQALLDSTVLDPEAVASVSSLAQSLIVATKEQAAYQPKVTGPISLVRALNDPNVARALSFGLGVARAFGSQLAQKEAGTLPQRR